jgi:hypothetical protein
MSKNDSPIPGEIKPGEIYRLIKVWIKKDAKSGIPVGVRKVKLSEIPSIGRPIVGTYESEHPQSGDPKKVNFVATKPVLEIKKLNGYGL